MHPRVSLCDTHVCHPHTQPPKPEQPSPQAQPPQAASAGELAVVMKLVMEDREKAATETATLVSGWRV